MRSLKVCSVPGCDRPFKAKGFCQPHYAADRNDRKRQLRIQRGFLTREQRKRDFGIMLDRFWSKVDRSGDCWIWTASTYGGYGAFGLQNPAGSVAAYRVAYALEVGPVPEGLELDHLCRNKLCVNPDHLEPVTHTENVLRGMSPAALCARKTHCKRGHEFTPENTGRATGGGRSCRACEKARTKRRLLVRAQIRLAQGVSNGDGKANKRAITGW